MSALRFLLGCWVLAAAAFIEFYARRYGYAGTPLVPLGLLALPALALLLLPARTFAAVPLGPEARRRVAVAVVCATALAFALLRPLQFVHVLIVAGLLAAALGALAPLLLRRRQPARLAAAAALAALTFALLAYYAILVIGLEMWNEIVTRKLIWTYLWQLPELVAALPVSPWLTWSAGAALYAALLLAYWLAVPGVAEGVRTALQRVRAYLLPSPAQRRRRWAALGLVLVSGALLADTVLEVVANGKRPDPLAATFIGGPRTRGTPNMPFVSNPALDLAARRAAERYVAPPAVQRRTLVLVTVDALRADQMHVYGHARENTPFLSRLHREGRLVRFDNAFSVCTESHCGLLAILAARYWHEMSTGRKPFGLADVLSRLGYRTHFLLGGDHTNFYDLRSFYGDSVDEYIDGSSASRYMNDDAEVIEWLRRLDVNGAAPRFIYVHLMSTHIVGKRHARFNLWRRQPLAGAGARCCSAAQVYQNNYHQGVRQADALIEEMFAILEAKGLLQDVLIAITADHGEMLGEFGVTLGHGGPPRDPVVRVPLLLYDARGFAYPPRRLASVIDVAPTLLDRIGAPVPELWSGMPLSRPEQPRFVFAQTRDEISVIGDFGGELYKYYYRTRPGALAEELVRLGPPGAEHTVPAGERPQVLSALRAELDRQLPGLRRAR